MEHILGIEWKSSKTNGWYDFRMRKNTKTWETTEFSPYAIKLMLLLKDKEKVVELIAYTSKLL